MFNKLRDLCLINGLSGDEDKVRDYIISKISDKCEYSVDNLGNIIAFKKGKKTPKNKILMSAHMDEVGLIVKYINDDGSLMVDSVGGVDCRVVFGRQVLVGENEMTGVVGGVAIHNLSGEEREKAVSIDKLTVDIGAESREEAEKTVALGDSIYFKSDYIEFGDGFIKSKAIDDRFGCALMLELIESELEYDTYFSFVVQEEIGLRGAKVASYTVNPDYAIVLEATTAADIPLADGEKSVCKCKSGPVISFMDRSTIYNKELYNLAFDLAKSNNIPCQTKTMIAGGNDAGAIHISRGGVKTMAVSIPCRYIHSPSCVAGKDDMINALKLVKLVLNDIYNK